jgi:DNA repair exonuclease SbcCD ATPase subunit
VINKKHQAFFEELHAKEQENLEAKQAIIEQIKVINTPIVNGEPLNAKQWDELSAKVQELQNAWRKIGFAPKKQNQAVYDAYRAECDRFFHTKTEFFKELRDAFSTNLKRKRSLIDQAKQIVDELKTKIESNEATRDYWDEATKQVQALQAEWKNVGFVARKYSDELWKQFSEVCDDFFNAKREAVKETKAENRKSRAARAARQAASQGAEGLRRMRDRLQQEIKTVENNILFFTAKSKTANKLVDSMQKKIDELKNQLADIQAKLDEEEEE